MEYLIRTCRKSKRQDGEKNESNHKMHFITLSVFAAYSLFRDVVQSAENSVR